MSSFFPKEWSLGFLAVLLFPCAATEEILACETSRGLPPSSGSVSLSERGLSLALGGVGPLTWTWLSVTGCLSPRI